MRTTNRRLPALALIAAVIGVSTLATSSPAVGQDLKGAGDQLTQAASARLQAGARAHRVAPNLATLGVSSSPAGILVGAAIPPDDGLRGILDGEPFALVVLEGTQFRIPKGTYRVELASDGEALLLRSNGTTAARGTPKIEFMTVRRTGYCEWDDYDDDNACLTCSYGNPSGPGGEWSVSTCFTIWNPFN